MPDLREHEHDPTIPPALDPVRDLTDEEYDATYASGDGGHKLPGSVAETLTGHGDPDDEPFTP